MNVNHGDGDDFARYIVDLLEDDSLTDIVFHGENILHVGKAFGFTHSTNPRFKPDSFFMRVPSYIKDLENNTLLRREGEGRQPAVRIDRCQELIDRTLELRKHIIQLQHAALLPLLEFQYGKGDSEMLSFADLLVISYHKDNEASGLYVKLYPPKFYGEMHIEQLSAFLYNMSALKDKIHQRFLPSMFPLASQDYFPRHSIVAYLARYLRRLKSISLRTQEVCNEKMNQADREDLKRFIRGFLPESI